MARGDKNYDKVVRKHNKGKTKSKARIAAVHNMVESMIQGNTAAAGDAFKTYMQIASREILLGEGDDESKMTDDDNDESVDDTADAECEECGESPCECDDDSDDSDDDDGEESDDDMDDDSGDDDTDDNVEQKIRQKMDEGKKGVNPFAKKGKKDDECDDDTGGDKFKKEKDKGIKSKTKDKSDAKNARPSRRGK